MPIKIQSVKLPLTINDSHLQQEAFFNMVNDKSFRHKIIQENAWKKIAGIDERGHLIGLSLEESQDSAAASSLENVQTLCKGLICKQASLFKHHLHFLCSQAGPSATVCKEHEAAHKALTKSKTSLGNTTTYNPQMTFTYPYTSQETLSNRTSVNNNQGLIIADFENNSFEINEPKLQGLVDETKDSIINTLSKNLEKSDIRGSDVTVLKLNEKDDFFLATKGEIETCHKLTWGMLVALVTSCQLPEKSITEYKIEDSEDDYTTSSERAKLIQT